MKALNTMQEQPATYSDDLKRHWIYVLGGPRCVEKAIVWQDRKRLQGKSYTVLNGEGGHPAAARLAAIKPEDVLYVLMDPDTRAAFRPEDLAERLRAESLSADHIDLKLFFSRSGDAEGSMSFAERTYRSMIPSFPRIVVFGYRGEVDTEGFEGHKTAGLREGESVAKMSQEDWLRRNARAQENRVRFPEEMMR